MRISLKKVLLWGSLLWLGVLLVLVTAIIAVGSVDRVESADVVIVLGAGLTRDGRPGWALQRRAAHAADVWQQGYAPAVICTGGQAPGYPRSEAEACRDVLMRYGVPSDVIVLETQSRSTEENALYSRTIMEERGWQTAIVVSDGYHVLRASYLFQRAGIAAVTSPVEHYRIRMVNQLVSATVREVLAFHWQVFKDILGLPITHIP